MSESGRGRFDLLPWLAIMRVAQRAELGAALYGEDNWRHGLPPARFFSSAVRHLAQWRLGQTDEDHLAAAAWNLLALIEVLDSGTMKSVGDSPSPPSR